MSTKHIKLAPPPFQRRTQLSVLPQVRRGIEYLDPETYAQASYYEKCHGTWDFFLGGRREFLISGSMKCSQCVSKWHFLVTSFLLEDLEANRIVEAAYIATLDLKASGKTVQQSKFLTLSPQQKMLKKNHDKTAGAEVKPAVQHKQNCPEEKQTMRHNNVWTCPTLNHKVIPNM